MTTWWTWRTSQVSFALCLGLYLLPLRFWARPAMWLGANMFLWFNFAAQEVGNYLAQEVRAPKSWLKSQASRAAHPNVSPSARMNFRPPSWYIHHKRPQLTLLGRVSPIFPLSPISHPLHELTNYTTHHNTLPISFVLCLPGDLLTLKARHPGQLDTHDDEKNQATTLLNRSDCCGSENVNPCGTPCCSFSQIKRP